MIKVILSACLIVAGLSSPSLAAESPLQDARQRWLRGNYDEARAQYDKLAKDPKTAVPALIGSSRCLESLGEYEAARTLIEKAIADHPKEAALHARHAELLYFFGKWPEAEKASQAALDLDQDNFLARWVRGQLYRDRADVEKADAEFRWFVRTYSERSEKDNDIKDPDALLLVGLAGTENARWHSLADQFQFLLNDLYADALKLDKDLWQAEYQAGMLLMEKYNRGEALSAFDKALTINPNAAPALVGKGMSALEKMDYQEAEKLAERALKINPRLPEALRLRADVYQASGNFTEAAAKLETARKLNPRDEQTLARIGANLLFQHKNKEFDLLAGEVAGSDPKPGLFYDLMAERLEERRWYDDAEKFYQKAAELRPMLPWPKNSLGLLYMRLGREADARKILTGAFEADPFNVRVSNMLKVLRHLDKYETLKTPHFELRFDPANDKALAHYMADYLEGIHSALSRQFGFEPAGPILVEVFNSHEMFSGRTVALPDLHTIGACTGKMFAMVSPAGKGVRKPFNWGRVLRHELVHIFNLEQTHFLVPHWFTEGLAVINEGYPRPQIWNELLLKKVPANQLLNLDTIDLGFIRPRSPEEWNQAYCQAQMYVLFLQKEYGQEKVGEMLTAYRDGLDTAAALTRVCKTDKATFEKGYRAYVDAVYRTLHGKPAEKALTLAQLKEAHEKEPDNADLSARLAEQLMRRDKIEARKLVDGVLKAKPNHPLASLVKAKLVLQGGDAEGARKLMEEALDRGQPEPALLLELGKLYYDANEMDKAREMFELGRQAEPYSSQWLVQLARVHAQADDKEKLIAVLKDLVPLDADDLDSRKRLARLLAQAGRNAEAEAYARQCLEIDIRDKEARETLVKALEAQKKDAEAAKLQEQLGK